MVIHLCDKMPNAFSSLGYILVVTVSPAQFCLGTFTAEDFIKLRDESSAFSFCYRMLLLVRLYYITILVFLMAVQMCMTLDSASSFTLRFHRSFILSGKISPRHGRSILAVFSFSFTHPCWQYLTAEKIEKRAIQIWQMCGFVFAAL